MGVEQRGSAASSGQFFGRKASGLSGQCDERPCYCTDARFLDIDSGQSLLAPVVGIAKESSCSAGSGLAPADPSRPQNSCLLGQKSIPPGQKTSACQIRAVLRRRTSFSQRSLGKGVSCKRSESCFFSKILRAYLHNSPHARIFYADTPIRRHADTPTRGFAVVAAPPRYVICGFKFGIRLIAPSSRHQ
jgi:hypothetical protein